jgi:putative oxidoreductase
MLTHGLPKMAMLLSGDLILFPPIFGMSPTLSLSRAVFAKVLCSIFIVVCFGTCLATVQLITTMLTAVFIIHAADPFAMKEMGILYLLEYIIYSLPAVVNIQLMAW